jgi:t-SNARE complex subunit (syntaxin)
MFYKQKLKACFGNINSRHKETIKLNKEFADVRELFQKYLQEVIFPIESKIDKIPEIQRIFDKWDENINFTSLFQSHTPS